MPPKKSQMPPKKRPKSVSDTQTNEVHEGLQEGPPEKKRKTRGASLMKSIAKGIATGERLPVDLNSRGQPIGKNKAKLSTFIGTTVKKWVPITVDNWGNVSEEEKDAIWEDVVGGFIIPPEMKKWVLKKANDLWRAFKKDLGRLHMHDKETGDIITEPPAIYDPYITQEQWTEFVRIRHSQEFKITTHAMEPSATVPRAILWMEARKGSNGQYAESSQSTIEKIKNYMDQEASGQLVISGQKDVLHMALGKLEHPRRIRGVGQDVTITQYWKRKNPAKEVVHEDSVSELKAKMKNMESTFGDKIKALELVIQKLMSGSQEKVNEVRPLQEDQASPTSQPCPQSDKASCSILKASAGKSEEENCQSCQLLVKDLGEPVAEGKVYHSSLGQVLLHTRPLESGYVKVSIVTPIMGDMKLPCPTEEATFVKDAVGQFIAWPEHLVISCEVSKHSEHDSSKKKIGEKTLTIESGIGQSDSDSMPRGLEAYNWIFEEFTENDVRHLEIPKEIFKCDHPGVDIGRGDIEGLFNKKEMKPCHMLLYIRYLYDTLEGDEDKFKFLCPNQISPHDRSLEQRAAYIEYAMDGDVKGKLFLAPYHFKSYKLKFFKLGMKTPRKDTRRHVVKCPRSSTPIDCGYYVLKFMRDIIHRGSSIIPLKWFSGEDTYKTQDIVEIQREWLDNLFALIMS